MKNIIKKTAATKNVAAQAESDEMKAQAKKKKAAGTNGENAEAKTEVERMCKGITTSDSVVTENVTGGWHHGRTELFTASEDKDHSSHKKN